MTTTKFPLAADTDEGAPSALDRLHEWVVTVDHKRLGTFEPLQRFPLPPLPWVVNRTKSQNLPPRLPRRLATPKLREGGSHPAKADAKQRKTLRHPAFLILP